MSTHLSRQGWTAIAAGLITALLIASSAEAAQNTTAAQLRVVDSNGKTLAEHTQYTGKTKVRTTPKADCFGDGTEGSGKSYRLGNANATGIVADASEYQRKLRPLRLTDAFYPDFGLGVCAIGGSEAPGGFWYLKRNHVAATASGDQTLLEGGDEVLWYLIEDFTADTPVELELKAKSTVANGAPIKVRVSAYDDGGNKSPAAGVEIKGTGVFTDAAGKAAVPSNGVITNLQAVGAGSIPSNRLKVCQEVGRIDCPNGKTTQLRGTDRRDRIRASRGPDTIEAYRGKDRIDIRRARNSSPPIIRCGPGKDTLIARKGQKFTAAKNCEKIKRKRK